MSVVNTNKSGLEPWPWCRPARSVKVPIVAPSRASVADAPLCSWSELATPANKILSSPQSNGASWMAVQSAAHVTSNNVWSNAL